MICFVLSAVLAGFAGMIQVMRLGSPLPSIGDGMELEAVAAAVIGGTALTGGIGTVLGGIIGAIAGGGSGAAVGAAVGAGAGAGTVVLQGRDNLELMSGTEFSITATAPANVGQIR